MSTITANKGETIHITQVSGTFYYAIGAGSTNTISQWPVSIANLNAASPAVTVLFDTSQNTVSDSTQYFICASSYITFDGSFHTFNVTSANYPGLVQNGNPGTSNGFSNITVQNIGVTSSGSGTLLGGRGWIGQPNFGYTASNCIFNRCYATGQGNLIGYSAKNSTANYCYFTGNIEQGGIFANSAVGCIANNCFTTGNVSSNGNNGGGIFGLACSSCTVNYCYTTGSRAQLGGAITGARFNTGTINNCYCIGGTPIGSNSSSTIYNSYFPYFTNTYGYYNNCYLYGNTWSDTAANAILPGTDGTIWTSPSPGTPNTPYILVSFNGQIYNPNKVYFDGSGSTYTSSNGLYPNPPNSYKILNSISSNVPNPSINASTGALSYTNVPSIYFFSKSTVLSYQTINSTFANYNVNTFTFALSTAIDASGSLHITQSGSTIYYAVNDASASPITDWPVSIINTNAYTSQAQLTVYIDTSLNITVPTQFFICATPFISFTGTSAVNTVNISSPNYPGFIRNGQSNNIGLRNVTIEKLGITQSIGGSLQAGAGWLAQRYFGGAANNTINFCYSTADASNSGGGLIGSDSLQVQANTCFSTGAINGGGVFGNDCSGCSATNCYSVGTIGANSISGGIFGTNAKTCTTANCYSTGSVVNGNSLFGPGASGSVASNCYWANSVNSGANTETNCYSYTGSVWLDSSANALLQGTDGTIWVDTDLSNNNVPYLLASFNVALYNPSLVALPSLLPSYDSSNGVITYAGTVYSIISMNNQLAPGSITINSGTGALRFTSLPNNYFSFTVKVLASKANNTFYNINTFTLAYLTLSASGTVNISAPSNTTIAYNINGTNGDIFRTWPVTIVNTQAAQATMLTVAINSNQIALSQATQYFICGSNYITFDGSANTFNVTATNYPGLIRNGTASINGKTNIIVQNIGVTTSGGGSLLGPNGWLGQANYGYGANAPSNCIFNRCYATGTGCLIGAGARFLTANFCYFTGTIVGGGIFSSCTNCTANNCFTTGDVTTNNGGGIFEGFSSNCTATNCYSVGGLTGPYTGGLYGAQTQYSSAFNCYCAAPYAVSIFSDTCFLQNCYFPSSYVVIQSSCYQYGSSWNDASAKAILQGTDGSIWTSPGTNKPFLLSTFNDQIYNPNTAKSVGGSNYTSPNGILTPFLYKILQVTSTNVPDPTINTATGALSYNIPPNNFVSTSTVLAYKQTSSNNYSNYNINTFTLSSGPSILASGTLHITQSGTTIFYAINNATPQPITEWPVAIVNSSASTTQAVLTVSFDTSLNISDASQSFVCGSPFINFTGTSSINTINITAPNYPGLINNGQSTSLGFANITIQNLGITSSNGGSLLAGGGWIAQKYFGANTNVVQFCYSTANVSSSGGGLIGDRCVQVVANTCFSTGAINGGGGIFGSDCSNCSATNCYSVGVIVNSGGIFGTNAVTCNVSNCYSTGNIVQGNSIFGAGASSSTAVNCYWGNSNDSGATSGSNCYSFYGTTWSDASANAILQGTDGTVWVDINLSQNNVPYLLASFNTALYNPSLVSLNAVTSTYDSSNALITTPGITYSIISVNDQDAPNTVTITAATGSLHFTSLPSQYFSLKVKVLATQPGNVFYNINTFTLGYLTLSSSGTINISVANNVIQYNLNGGPNYPMSAWPVTITNTQPNNGYLNVSINANQIALTQASQYFICGSDKIIFDGTSSVNTFNISAANYAGLIQNGLSGVSNGRVNIVVQNIGVIATGIGSLQQGSGWIAQTNFGLGAVATTNCSINRCYATGDGSLIGSGAKYVSANYCYFTGTIIGGGIFSSSSFCSATNCFTTGNITSNNGGGIIDGFSDNCSITNCYSTGVIVGQFAGGLFGARVNNSFAYNCYCAGQQAVGFDSILCSLNNCYFPYDYFAFKSNCYQYGSTWNDASANAVLQGTNGSIWVDIDPSQTNVPYLLASFNQALYDPSSVTLNSYLASFSSSSALIQNGVSYSIINVNNQVAPGNIQIAPQTGVLQFTNLPWTFYSLTVKVLSSKPGNVSYNINTFTLTYATMNVPGGAILIDVSNNVLVYSVNGGSYQPITLWPVTIVNSNFNRGAPSANPSLTVTFTPNISLTQSTQYFVCGSDSISFQGANPFTVFDVSASNYPGLIQNGVNGVSNGYSSITVQQIGITSSNGSLQANSGWLAQQYFGNGATSTTNCLFSNCYSTAPGSLLGQNTRFVSANKCFVTAASSNLFGNSNTNCNVSNCYAAGASSSVFGSNSNSSSAVASYSTGGDLFGSNSSTSSATNSYFTSASPGNYSKSNCYNFYTGWNDADASSNLTGIIGGSVWISRATNTPFLLTSFGGQIYSPNSITWDGSGTSFSSVSGAYPNPPNSYSIINIVSSGAVTNPVISSSTGSLTYSNLSKNNSFLSVVTVLASQTNYTNYNINRFTLQFTAAPPSNVCFPAGTPVRTDQGVIDIDRLVPGTNTIRGMPIQCVTRTINEEKHLILIKKDALGKNVPCRDTRISMNHHILYKGSMRKARELLHENLDGVFRVKYNGETLYNVLLDNHEKMVVNNMICETLHPEHGTAQFFMALQNMSPQERFETIQAYSEYVKTNRCFSSQKSIKF